MHVQYILFTDLVVGFNPNEIGICKMTWINGICLGYPADVTLNDSWFQAGKVEFYVNCSGWIPGIFIRFFQMKGLSKQYVVGLLFLWFFFLPPNCPKFCGGSWVHGQNYIKNISFCNMLCLYIIRLMLSMSKRNVSFSQREQCFPSSLQGESSN